MAGTIAVLLFLTLAAAISYFGYRQYARPGRILERVGTAALVAESEPAVATQPTEGGGFVRIIRQVGEKVPLSPRDASLTRRYLFAAGFRSDNALYTFYGLKVTLCVAMLFTAFVFRGYVVSLPILQVILVVAAAVTGYALPGLVLERRVARRQERIRFSLPDALDLMVVAVEAGLGLDQAMQNVSRELGITHPEIAEEFGLVTLEMRAGKRRSEALRNLADRTGQPDIRQLVAILIQTDRFGTSMAESLRTHSEFLRVRRRQEAEERANKIGVKLVFPIFFCILPAMFIVMAGPAVLLMVKQLLPMLRQGIK